MINRRVQAGNGMVRTVLLLFFLSVVAKGVFSLIPIYLEHAKLESAVTSFLDDRLDGDKMARTELLNELGEYLARRGVHSIDERDFTIVRDRSERRWLKAEYSGRVSFIGNIDLIVSFDDINFDVTSVTVL